MNQCRKMICVIPVREGSKRFPGKNLKEIDGKSMLAHTIHVAKQAKIFTEIFVSTDSIDMKNVAEKSGALVPFLRPDYLSSDKATSVDVVFHLMDNIDIDYDSIAILQVTSPLRNEEHLMDAFAKFDKNGNSLMSFEDISEKKSSLFNFNNNQIAQLEINGNLFKANGAIYMFDKTNFVKTKKIYNENTYPYIMKNFESVDIDYEYEYLTVLSILNSLKNKESSKL